jgi:aldose sugar dehydrogenase
MLLSRSEFRYILRTSVFLFLSLVLSAQFSYKDTASTLQSEIYTHKRPTIEKPNLGIDIITTGIDFPSDMAFLGVNDILVLEKNQGIVRRIVNGQMLDQPLLDINNLSNSSERGLLGVATTKKVDKGKDDEYYVYLYFSESVKVQGGNNNRDYGNKEYVYNRIYRYELVGSHLINSKLLLNLPASPATYHNGGKMLVGPDSSLYVAVGDFGLGRKDVEKSNKVQNNREGADPDGRAGILRITQDGEVVNGLGILGEKSPLDKYFAYGIRNSFGMDFDPVTGNLWNTENGPNYGDEINLVRPGFNSGWNKIQGFWEPNGEEKGRFELNPNNLVDFNGMGKYSNPEFVWNYTVGLTALKFLNSSIYGEEYEDDMFVGDFNNGNLYHFELNEEQDRTELSLGGDLEDKVADTQQELEEKLFGEGFTAITDIEVSPDGYLYILSLHRSGHDCDPKFPDCIKYDSSVYGTLFKIYPSNQSQ